MRETAAPTGSGTEGLIVADWPGATLTWAGYASGGPPACGAVTLITTVVATGLFAPSLAFSVAEYMPRVWLQEAPTYAVTTPFRFLNPAIVIPAGTPAACTESVPGAIAESETTATGKRDTVPSAGTDSGPWADIPGGGFRIVRS